MKGTCGLPSVGKVDTRHRVAAVDCSGFVGDVNSKQLFDTDKYPFNVAAAKIDGDKEVYPPIVKKFVFKSKLFSLVSFDIPDGIVPDRLFVDKVMSSRALSVTIVVGIDPEKEFEFRYIYCRRLKALILSGIDPFRLLECKYNPLSTVRVLTDDGIVPVRKFPPK